VSDPERGVEYRVGLRGLGYAPRVVGPRPVVVLLHGKQVTRRGRDFALPYEAGGACRESPAVQIPSYRRFGELARNLASHGYLVVAPDANDISERDGSGDSGTSIVTSEPLAAAGLRGAGRLLGDRNRDRGRSS
jgi:dienelactone hydrolase